MIYSKVELYSPEDQEIVYQSGVTDKNGGFAFIPNASGLWKFNSNDGQGHLASGEIEVIFPEVPLPGAEQAAGEPSDSATSEEPKRLASGGAGTANWEKIALGLSVIFNIALVTIVLRKSPKAKPTA
jgi:hypothetical protein